ncbi:MAG: HEAT repeat domain-containing protein [Candidatus Cyclobacteriaceae bacterium M2_1C_046]
MIRSEIDNITFIASEFPVLIKVMILLSLLFSAITILLFFFMLINRLFDNYQNKRKSYYEKKAIAHIISFLFNEEEWNIKRLKQVRRKYLGTKFQREVFLSCLTKFQIRIVGKDAERLRKFYIGLKLHRRSLKKLNSTSWTVTAKGLIELAEMDMKEYTPLIRRYINHRNPVIRAEAQVALIQLQSANPFEFLNHLEEPLLDWQQVQLAHVSEQLKATALPDFKQWLDHKEVTVVIFCLRMISLHNQRNASRDLVNMLYRNSSSPKVYGAVIFAIGQLDLHEASDYLQSAFPYENPYIRQEITNTLGILNNMEPEEVYKSIYKKEKLFMEQFYHDTTVFIPKAELSKKLQWK